MRPHPSDSKIRRQLHVRGIVQGVGFRLFVYKLATSLGLTGFVFNSSSGVTVEIEGDATVIRTFIDSLELDPPPLAEILELTVSEMTTVGSAGFDILQSREEVGEFALVSPDVEAALQHARRPIVVLPRSSAVGSAPGALPDVLAPGNNT